MRSLLSVLLFLCCAAAVQAQRTLIEWRFDRPEVLKDWQTNADMADIRVTDGALHFRGVGGDPILVYRPPFDIAASPWQAVVVRLKADRDGIIELFWSSTDKGQYGGFSQDMHTTFAVRGDGQWHDYRVFPFWQKEKRIIRFRFDPYGGAEFSLASIRIVQEEPEGPGRAAFDFENGAQGWTPMHGAKVERVPSGINVILNAADGFALAPVPNVDAEANPVAAIRLATATARRVSLVYATTESYGLQEYSFAVISDGQEHLYNLDMLNGPGWTGRIAAVGLRPGEREGEGVRLRSLRIAASPQGPPELRPLWFGIEDALPRAGASVTVSARVTNAGGENARGLRASLLLPAGAKLLKFTPPTGSSLRFGQEAEWRWQVQFARPGVAMLALRLTAENAPTVISRAGAKLTPRLTGIVRGVMPEPQPVRGKYDVGVYYFPGWKSASSWAPIVRFPERRPVLGWYREGDPQIADWQVKWAVEHGITFFAYDWYWSQGARALEHALHEGLFHAKYGRMLKFCLLWANHNAEHTSSYDDLMAVTQYWIANYFRRPEYYTIDGKPVVIIFTPYRFRADMGSAEVRRAFDAMKEACRRAGLKGLYMIACVGGDPGETRAAQREGYDAITAYNWPGLGVQGAERWSPYDKLVDAYRKQWERLAETGPLPMMLPICGGWDSRPWHGESALVRSGRNPDNFRRHLEDGLQFIETHPGRTLPVALIEAWNEFGEGSYIEPHREFGFGYLDAIRDVFTAAPKEHQDLTPADAGVEPPQVEFVSLTQSRWDFARGLQGWTSMMNQTEAKIEGGAMTVRTTGDDPAFNSPPVQLPADNYRTLRLRMKLQSVSGPAFADTVQLFWTTRSAPTSEAASVKAAIQADGQWHDYRVSLAANPRWRGIITGLRLDPCNRKDVRVQVRLVELLP